ncbi:HNH endonuclease [Salmonella enterica]
MLVDHKCHNTLCVNPSHLRLVTPKQNSENREARYHKELIWKARC